MIETSLMVNDYPEPPEEPETPKVTIVVYAKLTFKDVEMTEDQTPEEAIKEIGIYDYDEIEIEDAEVEWW